MTRLAVDDIFGSSPRHGGRYWWPRSHHLEASLHDLFNSTSGNKVVVIDGATGTGKTSLAYRGFYKNSVQYNAISVTSDMDWKELCRQVVSVPKSDMVSQERKLGFSIKQFLPGGSVDTRHQTSHDPLRDLEFAEKFIDRIAINDLVRVMLQEGVALLVDDFEKANSALVAKVADFAKALSNPVHPTSHSKLIIVTCGASYSLITATDDSLARRILYLNIGGLAQSGQSWKFLTSGFDKLSMKHPGNSKILEEQQLARQCQDFAYDATGGLLKNLTELGHITATPAYRNKSVTAKSFIKRARTMAQRNIDDYSRQYPILTALISKDPHVAGIIGYLYRRGITIHHELAVIEREFSARGHLESVAGGISQLINVGFLVATGVAEGRLFVAKPNLALAFCVAVFRKDHYRVPFQIRNEMKQHSFPLVLDW